MRKQSHLFLDLHRAARGGASETLSSLLEIVVASEISLTAEGNATLLHSASENGRLECVRILREGYVPINIRDDRGKTPLMKAVENSHLDVVNELLLADDLDPKIADYNGETALHISSRLGDMKITEALVERGAVVNAKTSDGSSPLHFAAIANERESATFLLENGAEINMTNNIGQTPLLSAVQANSYCAWDLLACGADTNVVDNHGKTAQDLALSRGNTLLFDTIGVVTNRFYFNLGKGETDPFLVRLSDQLDRLGRNTESETELRLLHEKHVEKIVKSRIRKKDLAISNLQLQLEVLKKECEFEQSKLDPKLD